MPWPTALIVALGLLVSRPVLAAEVRTEVESRTVGVGETFSVRVTIVQGEDEPRPTTPSLPVEGPAQVHGPSVGTQRRVVMHNFDVRTENNVIATWSVTPTKTGELTVGPARVRVGSKTLRGEEVTIEVVDEPRRSRRRQRRKDPFSFGPDPFGRDPRHQDPFDILRQRRLGSRYPLAPPELELQEAPDPLAFLHARVDKHHAVVGEPVTLEIYAYGSRGKFRELSPTEPSLSNFLSYQAVETSHEQPIQRAEIDGREFLVVKLREIIIVPLKTGQLEIGEMEAVLRGAGNSYPPRGSRLGTKVSSQPLTISVTEPPARGRPPGYRLGDVGRFQLSATVKPRELVENDFFSVQIEVRGKGNVPASLDMPDISGIIWGEPSVRGELEVKDGWLAGTRLLEFTPQVTKTGQVNLEEVQLPHFDPRSDRYRMAQIDLGQITVKPAETNTGPQQPEEAQASPHAPLMPRSRMGEDSAHRPPPPLWAFAAAALLPLLTFLLSLLPLASRKIAGFWERLRAKEGRLDLSAAQRAAKSGDVATLAKELERAGYALVEARTGLKARGILREHLGGELIRRGVPEELAQQLQQLFIDLETHRYQAGTQGDDKTAEELHERAKRVLRALKKASLSPSKDPSS